MYKILKSLGLSLKENDHYPYLCKTNARTDFWIMETYSMWNFTLI